MGCPFKTCGRFKSTDYSNPLRKKGEAIGYNSGWVAPAETRIATLPLGHADGIGRHFGNQKGTVVIKGQKAPIIGNVCMDMLMVEVGNIPCEEGDEVTFLGHGPIC